MTTLVRIVRAFPLVLPLALVAPLITSGEVQAAAADDEEGEGKTYDYGAKVKIELRMEDGTTVRHRGELRSFGNEWRFEFDGAGHHHVVTLDATHEEGDKELEVTLAWDRDGESIIAPYTDSYPVRKRQSLWSADGKLAIAMTFKPTKFEREDSSRDDKEKLNPDDDDNPLGGNLFK
ncbi:hypothetical protein ENSA5_19820 [Enhygromyxa salina]|uniref:Uncharacterized protein n=1 Tax=Enhygromyxa salina TaxID=215803 RepID=A0A2S9YCX1_9BACT|nr:hypothetical protein [Enhygromyxa salina]PRQ02892.1 hypothetical protein ENSA5_19820 [Enhygromyxa salina]